MIQTIPTGKKSSSFPIFTEYPVHHINVKWFVCWCDFFRWEVSVWNPCSVSCGVGLQTRSVSCVRSVAGNRTESVSSIECVKRRPPELQACNQVACPPAWEAEEWQQVSHLTKSDKSQNINEIAYPCKNYKLVHGNKLGQNKMNRGHCYCMQYFNATFHATFIRLENRCQKRCIKICAAQYWEKFTLHYFVFLLYIYCDVKKYRNFH